MHNKNKSVNPLTFKNINFTWHRGWKYKPFLVISIIIWKKSCLNIYFNGNFNQGFALEMILWKNMLKKMIEE